MKNKLNKNDLFEMIEQELMSIKPVVAVKKPDHEGRMARSEIRDLIQNAIKLYNMIDKEDELPGWVSAYITLSCDYIHSVTQHMTEERSSDKELEDVTAPDQQMD